MKRMNVDDLLFEIKAVRPKSAIKVTKTLEKKYFGLKFIELSNFQTYILRIDKIY